MRVREHLDALTELVGELERKLGERPLEEDESG